MTAGVCRSVSVRAARPTGPTHPTWDPPVLRAAARTLPNGLRVIFAENHAVPVLWMGWVVRAGIVYDPPAQAGLAVLTPLLLREGTARRSAAQFTCDVENLGAHLGLGCDWDSAFVSLELLACDLAAGIELLFDLAWGATFPAEAVARLRQQKLGELERRGRQAAALADLAFARAVYGDSIYGQPPLGTPDTLRHIEAAGVAAFHAAHYGAADGCFVLAGSFDSARAEALLGACAPPARAPRPVPVFACEARPTPAVQVVDVPRAARTELRVGQAGVAQGHPDLPALQVLAALLGGGPSSRLAAHLRQRLALTYQVRSRFMPRGAGGAFVVETTVASPAVGTALAAIRHEIERLCEEPLPAAELEQVRRRLLGEEIRRFHTIIDTGRAFAQVALEADPVRHFERRWQALQAVEPEALRELARRHLHPEDLVAVAAGPAEVLQAQLARTTDAVRRPVAAEAAP